MKHFATWSFILLVLMVAQGCTSNERTPAGPEGSTNTPQSARAAAPQPAEQADPAANGGSSLQASTPYQGSGAAVSQNLNPAPFLTASQPQGQTSSTATAPSETLTSRADGTMRGPNDLPTTFTGGGSPAQPESPGKATKKAPKHR